MKSVELTEKYLQIIFSGKNLDDLENLFATDLQFNGPWFQFSSAVEYISSLKEHPFTDVTYEIVKSFGNTSTACVIYRMSAHGVNDTPMAVFSTINNDKINSILLIFDTATFKEGKR